MLESVRRTGRLVVVSEAPRESSITADIAARVTEEAFYSLAAPVLRVAGFDTPYPPSRLEDEYLPDLDKVLRRRRPRAGLLSRRREAEPTLTARLSNTAGRLRDRSACPTSARG